MSLNRYVTEALSSSVGSAPAGWGRRRPARSKLRMALATNVVVVVLAAGVAAIVLLVLALERGI